MWPCLTLALKKQDDGRIQDWQGGLCVGMTGSSITHINLLSLVALVSPQNTSNTYHCLGQSLYAAIQKRLQPTQPLSFLSSWLVLVLPLLLNMTLFANHPTVFFALLSVPTGSLLYSPMPKSGTPLPCVNLQFRRPRRLAIKSRSLPC